MGLQWPAVSPPWTFSDRVVTQASTKPRLVFSLPLDPARLLRARHRIRDYLTEHVADAAAVDDVVLAIEEAMTNAVRHSGAAEDLDVTVSFHGDELVATVRDYGRGFDVDGFDMAALPDVEQPGGRGLYLISRLMDELHLHRDHGLELRAVKRTSLREDAHSAGRLEDMTPGALAHRDLSQRKMLDELPELYAALDWEFRYLYVNRMFCQVTGCESQEVLGRTLWEVFPEVRGNWRQRLRSRTTCRSSCCAARRERAGAGNREHAGVGARSGPACV